MNIAGRNWTQDIVLRLKDKLRWHILIGTYAKISSANHHKLAFGWACSYTAPLLQLKLELIINYLYFQFEVLSNFCEYVRSSKKIQEPIHIPLSSVFLLMFGDTAPALLKT